MPGVSKFTISLPEDLLGQIDAVALETGETRSGIIREAAGVYLRHRDEAAASELRRRGAEEALAMMRAIAAEPRADDRSSLELLREVRDADGLGEPKDVR